MDTPLTRTHLCRLLGGQSVLEHQPELSLTLATKESGRVDLFFPWQSPSLPLASFREGQVNALQCALREEPILQAHHRSSEMRRRLLWVVLAQAPSGMSKWHPV